MELLGTILFQFNNPVLCPAYSELFLLRTCDDFFCHYGEIFVTDWYCKDDARSAPRSVILDKDSSAVSFNNSTRDGKPHADTGRSI